MNADLNSFKNDQSYTTDWGSNKLSRRTFLAGLGTAAASTILPLGFASAASIPDSLVNRWMDDRCLVRRSVNMWWAKQCEFLPCFHGVAYPGYAERVYNTKVNDIDVIIHAWKGYCHKFDDMKKDPRLKNRFPGGYGGEVGIYRVRDKSWFENNKNKIEAADSMWKYAGGWPRLAAIRNAAAFERWGGSNIWYPAPELKQKIYFRLYHEKGGKKHVLIDTRARYNYLSVQESERAEDYYWCTEFVEDESYERWERYVTSGNTINPVELTMEFWIGDLHGEWKYRGPCEKVCMPDAGCCL